MIDHAERLVLDAVVIGELDAADYGAAFGYTGQRQGDLPAFVGLQVHGNAVIDLILSQGDGLRILEEALPVDLDIHLGLSVPAGAVGGRNEQVTFGYLVRQGVIPFRIHGLLPLVAAAGNQHQGEQKYRFQSHDRIISIHRP